VHDQVAGKPSLKERALHEFKLYVLISLYLLLFLGAFELYRELILKEAGVNYLTYGFTVVEALVIGKIILIGEALHLGKRFEHKRLIVSVIFKTIVFGLFIAAFNVLEHVVEALIHKKDWVAAIFEKDPNEMLARSVVMMVALIPLVTVLEIGRVLGPGKLSAMFFSKR